ncbi:hypothetical protein ACI7BZ_20160 [Xanthobacter sp. AM11]|uniref:hypothetical protein n=1 Tax=Xanthobacter sp. AM11 TaxID=3380643 RepID=UPI0039BFA620
MSALSAFTPFVLVAAFLAPALALAAGEPAGAASGGAAPVWPDTPEARQAAQGQIEALNAALLAQASATATLEGWCAGHRIANPALVRAERVRAAEGPAPEAVRALLGAGPDTPVRHRRVRLTCGAVVLSEADNYYLPDRLTPQMNAVLDTTDTPFGKVVRPLDFRRRTLEARMVWTPADTAAPALAHPQPAPPLAVPVFVLEHRAVLTLPDGTPFSALMERYTSGILANPAP